MTTPTKPPIITQLADYICRAREQPVKRYLHEAAIRCIFDLLTAAAVGVKDVGAAATRQVALQALSGGRAPIWFTKQTSNPLGAAYANSAAASALDLDDGNRIAMGHPGAAVIPVACSLAFELDLPLPQLIAAVVIGYEVAVTVAAARTEFGETMTWSVYGVVAANAALRKLGKAVIENALGIAGQHISSRTSILSPALAGSHVKEGIPWSVFCGMQAVLLAEAGYTGPINHLEDDKLYQFPVTMGLGLGSSEHILATYFKLYTCCRYIHAPIEALLELMTKHTMKHPEIDAIEVQTFGRAFELPNRTRPSHLVDIQYSIPYCMAIVAIQGPANLAPLTEDLLNRDDLTSFAQRVRVVLEPAIAARFPGESVSRIVVQSGSSNFTSNIVTPRGEASKPLSWEEQERKFRTVMRDNASVEQQDRFIAAMRALREGSQSPWYQAVQELILDSNR